MEIHSELKGIWTQDLAILAEESIDEAFEYHNKNIDIGEIYLIYGAQNGKQTLLGISGYFPVKEDYSEFMLRWHGLLKEHQNFGYSKNVISFLAKHIKEKYPQAEKLKEFMPIIDSYASIQAYFERIGFKKDGNAEIVDWSEHKWQEFSLDLPKFLQQKKLKA